jgi:hypothetical protein
MHHPGIPAALPTPTPRLIGLAYPTIKTIDFTQGAAASCHGRVMLALVIAHSRLLVSGISASGIQLGSLRKTDGRNEEAHRLWRRIGYGQSRTRAL